MLIGVFIVDQVGIKIALGLEFRLTVLPVWNQTLQTIQASLMVEIRVSEDAWYHVFSGKCLVTGVFTSYLLNGCQTLMTYIYALRALIVFLVLFPFF